MQVIFYMALRAVLGINYRIRPLIKQGSYVGRSQKISINNRVMPLIPHANLRPSAVYADVIGGFRFATLGDNFVIKGVSEG